MNKWIFRFSNSSFTLLILCLVSFVIMVQFSWNGKENPSIISSDGVGYYQYLPNTFINKTISNQTPDNRFFSDVNGHGVNKYYVGTAVAMSPFFVFGHLGAIFQGEKTNGYSTPYHKAISLAGLTYLILGLLFFRGLLRLYELKERTISLSILVLVLGTNLLAYSLLMPSMSHVYSFFFITGFLFCVKKYSIGLKSLSFYLAIVFLGMIILIRPINGIIVLAIPFLCGSKEHLKLILASLSRPVKILFGLSLLAVIIFIQAFFWHLQCGEWIVWSYSGEGFDFVKPHLIDFLMSFRKGALIYTPILFLSILGLGVVFKKSRFQGWSLILFFVLLIYLVSSWWNWYYGPSFGQRPLVEFYGLSGLLIAFLIQGITTRKKTVVLGLFSFACIGLNLIQTYQYQTGIISSWDMNKEKYAYTFLKLDDSYQQVLGGNNDILLFNAEIDTVFNQNVDFDAEQEGIEVGNKKYDEDISSRVCNYENSEFNFAMTIKTNDHFISQRGIFLKVKYQLKDIKKSKKNQALFVVDIKDSLGETYHYGTFPIRDIPTVKENKWMTQSYSIEIKEIKSPKDIVKVYIWNKELESFLIDEVEVQVLAIN